MRILLLIANFLVLPLASVVLKPNLATLIVLILFFALNKVSSHKSLFFRLSLLSLQSMMLVLNITDGGGAGLIITLDLLLFIFLIIGAFQYNKRKNLVKY